MKYDSINKTYRWLRSCLLIVLGMVGTCALLYAYIYVASITGRQSIVVDGVERTYRVHLPSGYDASQPAPLVLAFHMLTGSGRTMEWLTHFNRVSDQNGFIVVYPDGYESSWADGSGLYSADIDYIDDVAFSLELIDELQSKYDIDAQRIYATGFSNGGFFAQRLACEASDRLAAVSTVGATLARNALIECAIEEPVAVMMVNGEDDPGVPWDGTEDYTPIPGAVKFWAIINGCEEQPEITQLPELADDGTQVRRELYSACKEGVEVTLYAIQGGGHTWPLGSQPVQLWGLLNGRISREMDASQMIWEFFERHTK